MSYTITINRYGRDEQQTDLVAFAYALANELGGQLLKGDEYPNERQRIALGPDILILRGNHYGAKGRVEVCITAAGIFPQDRDFYSKSHKTAEATVNPDGRDIAAIARDIKRRVIDASQEALKAQRDYAAQRALQRNGVASYVGPLTDMGLRVDVASDGLTASLWNQGGHYLSGRLQADGTVYLDRVGSMDLETFKRVLAVLNGREASL